MESNTKNVSEKSKKSVITIIMFVVAAVVTILGVALLVNNVLLFKSTVNQYVAQGYTAATVKKELMTSQLLPGIFEPVAVYGDIAFLLLGVGIVNKKVSKCLILLSKAEVCSDIVKENIVDQNVVNVENVEKTKQTETVEAIVEAKAEESTTETQKA